MQAMHLKMLNAGLPLASCFDRGFDRCLPLSALVIIVKNTETYHRKLLSHRRIAS